MEHFGFEIYPFLLKKNCTYHQRLPTMAIMAIGRLRAKSPWPPPAVFPFFPINIIRFQIYPFLLKSIVPFTRDSQQRQSWWLDVYALNRQCDWFSQVLQRQDDLTLSALHQLQVSEVLNIICVLIGYFKVLNRLLFSPMIEDDRRLTFGQIRFLTYSFLIPASNHVCADCAHTELNAQKREAKFDSDVRWRLFGGCWWKSTWYRLFLVFVAPPKFPSIQPPRTAPHEFIMIWMILKMAADGRILEDLTGWHTAPPIVDENQTERVTFGWLI